ncbi:hypothetical protein [Sulfobacillus thermosulfidooxidans]|nr:hypothetical protein [Sulfobacillus thermosulfidooxidans]PSR27460.1 MAG: hypothetical protein C7B47_07795 [Sulfobacillus thermosulfidooxidans]
MALANPARIRGESIEANEFAEWSEEEGVYAVPKTVMTVKDLSVKHSFEGALSEDHFIRQLKGLLEP